MFGKFEFGFGKDPCWPELFRTLFKVRTYLAHDSKLDFYWNKEVCSLVWEVRSSKKFRFIRLNSTLY